jgi:hypothetical protein
VRTVIEAVDSPVGRSLDAGPGPPQGTEGSPGKMPGAVPGRKLKPPAGRLPTPYCAEAEGGGGNGGTVMPRLAAEKVMTSAVLAIRLSVGKYP